jgi:hypothetical protein
MFIENWSLKCGTLGTEKDNKKYLILSESMWRKSDDLQFDSVFS